MQNADLLSNECSGPAVHSEEPGVPPQDQTACVLGCVSWRTPRPGSDRCRGPEADWPGPWTSPAGWGWGAEDRVSGRLRGWQCYTPRTLRGHKKEKSASQSDHSTYSCGLTVDPLWMFIFLKTDFEDLNNLIRQLCNRYYSCAAFLLTLSLQKCQSVIFMPYFVLLSYLKSIHSHSTQYLWCQCYEKDSLLYIFSRLLYRSDRESRQRRTRQPC